MGKMTRMAKGVATHISLVNRGANQTPFKVIKADNTGANPMIDLNNIRKRVTKQATEQTVVAVVVKGADLQPEVLARYNLEPTEVQKSAEQGDVHVIEKAAFEDVDSDLRIVEVQPGVAIVCKGFRPYSDDFVDNASFTDIIKARTLPLYQFGDIVSDMIRDGLYQADSKAAAITTAHAILDDAKNYISGLLNDLPDLVFKMALDTEVVVKAAEEPATGEPAPKEGAVNETTEGNTAAGEGTGSTGTGGGETPVVQVEGETGVQETAAEPAVEGATNPEPTGEVAAAPEAQPVVVEKAPANAAPAGFDMAAFALVLTPVIESIVQKSVGEKMVTIEKSVQSIADGSEANLKEVKNTIAGTVMTSVTKSDTRSNQEPVEENAGVGIIDTAYGRPRN